MNRVDYIQKKDCNGCSVCIATCPQNCIEMSPDNEGFLYPSVIISKCIDCEECYYSCPSIKTSKDFVKPFNNEVYACQAKEDNMRHISSSGGAFSALSFPILRKCGIQ